MFKSAPRIGHGYDIHRLQSGGKLKLAGITVARGISPIAHSDGDVALHALVDALLGAVGLGDIGQMFPNTQAKWKRADSRTFVTGAMKAVRDRGYAVANVDVTILAERPKLQQYRTRMVDSLQALVGGEVNIKAGTNEGCDAVGRGEAIAAHVVVLLVSQPSKE